MFKRNLSVEQMVDLWEEQREIKNLMGRFSFAFLYKDEDKIFEQFWSAEPDVCYGINSGWYIGAEAIRDYFAAHAAIRDKSDEIKTARFPKVFEGRSNEEIHGIGALDQKPLGLDYVVIAGDMRTAKGIWVCNGQYVDNTPEGPVARYTCGEYAVDFIREGDAWKIWHMQYLEDVNCPVGDKWWGTEHPEFKKFQEFAPLDELKIPEPNRPCVLREYYSTQRPFAKFPVPPVPYKTFSETFSYGC